MMYWNSDIPEICTKLFCAASSAFCVSWNLLIADTISTPVKSDKLLCACSVIVFVVVCNACSSCSRPPTDACTTVTAVNEFCNCTSPVESAFVNVACAVVLLSAGWFNAAMIESIDENMLLFADEVAGATPNVSPGFGAPEIASVMPAPSAIGEVDENALAAVVDPVVLSVTV